ncbi:F-box/kelch-repeat protein At3g23880-like [Vicia villosa]|uniref:F-box/kelch-repeat protein At3g23880-like n=1 Tax=Vicia villosa TaxID=3911 RepID=UPI00273C1D97|nr:F-box/kelch-repeat protein At3g23880-like [Vicia villosa]
MASLFNGGSVSPLTLTLFSSGSGSGSGESLPFDLIVEILYRLPVKLLLQLRCVCKSWNFIISDPKFARKHLTHSTTLGLHLLSCFKPPHKCSLKPYLLHAVIPNVTTNFTRTVYPHNNFNGYYYILTGLNCFVGSCHGLLCLSNHFGGLVIIWNPSIRKINELPLIQMPKTSGAIRVEYSFGFGYDHVNDDYKVVVLLSSILFDNNYYMGIYVEKTQVKVHTLGTDYWKSIPDFPFGGILVRDSGQFVSGTINWLAYDKNSNWEGHSFIISFDLKKECFRQILQPDYEDIRASARQLGVWKDCMWVVSGRDVWLMKEYGNKESWTKLFTISCDFWKVKNILEDDQVLLESNEKMSVYNFKNHTFKFTKFGRCQEEICVESLISPFPP